MTMLEVKDSKVKNEWFQKLFQKQFLSTWQFLRSFLKEMTMLLCVWAINLPEFSTLLFHGSFFLLWRLDPPSDIHLPTSPKLNKKQIKASNVNLEVMWTVTDYFYWVSLKKKKNSKASVPLLLSCRGLALWEGKPSVLLFPDRRWNTEKLDYLESTSVVILQDLISQPGMLSNCMCSSELELLSTENLAPPVPFKSFSVYFETGHLGCGPCKMSCISEKLLFLLGRLW